MFIKRTKDSAQGPIEKRKDIGVDRQVKVKKNIVPTAAPKDKNVDLPILQGGEVSFPKGKSDSMKEKVATIPNGDMNDQKYVPFDMTKLLSQMTIKVPLLEMMRIEEHRLKTLEWVNGFSSIEVQEIRKDDKHIASLEDTHETKNEEIISQIPQIFLDTNVVNSAS